MQIKRLLQILTVYGLSWPLRARADGLVPCTGLDCTFESIMELFANIFNWLIGLAGLVAMGFIVWAAARMLYWSFLEDAEAELVSAKRTLTRAIVGFVIVAAAWVIVNTVITIVSGGSVGISTFMNILNGS